MFYNRNVTEPALRHRGNPERRGACDPMTCGRPGGGLVGGPVKLPHPKRAWRNARRDLEQLTRFLGIEFRQPAPHRLSLLRAGFFSSRAALYPFDRYDRRWFLSDWAVENRLRGINPPDVSAQLGNKLFFHLVLRELGLGGKTAPLVGMLNDGRLTPFSSWRSVAEAIEAHGRVVVKPVSGFGGQHVRLLGAGDAVPGSGNYIVEGALRQHAYAAEIFPGSANTIRVFTLRPAGGEPFIAGAAHRFGTMQTAPVDNFSRGGLSALVDEATGRLSAAKSKSKIQGRTLHIRHPDTGAPIEGTTVPRWAEVKALALELAGCVPGLRLGGWDVCVTAEGPRLIEGNGSVPNPNVIQMHWPVLLNARTRKFFADHGVISRRDYDELTALARELPPPATSGGAGGEVEREPLLVR